MSKYKTKKEVVKEFKMRHPRERYRHPKGYFDTAMRHEDWSNYTDALCKNGEISLRQYEKWVYPFKN